MARVLITGMSGTGKTSVLDELHRRGRLTLDTDYDGWVLADHTWDEARMTAFLRDNEDVFVAGTVDNQGRFYDRFEHVILLSAPVEVLVERVTARTSNPYGKTPEQRAEIERYVQTVEPLLRRGASAEFDSQRPTRELADLIENSRVLRTDLPRTAHGGGGAPATRRGMTQNIPVEGVQLLLADQGQHRALSILDLLIAATAELAG